MLADDFGFWGVPYVTQQGGETDTNFDLTCCNLQTFTILTFEPFLIEGKVVPVLN